MMPFAIRALWARMVGYGAVNVLIGGTIIIYYMHFARGCLSGDLAEKQQVGKLSISVEMSWRERFAWPASVKPTRWVPDRQ